MPLVLTLHRARDPVDRQRESRTLDEGTLTIGRGTGNAWVLQDPAQHLSKTHCIVSATRGGYMLTDCSSNGVFLNGSKQRMPRDSQVAAEQRRRVRHRRLPDPGACGRRPVQPRRRRGRRRRAARAARRRSSATTRSASTSSSRPPPAAARAAAARPGPAAARLRPVRRPRPRPPGRPVRRRRPARRPRRPSHLPFNEPGRRPRRARRRRPRSRPAPRDRTPAPAARRRSVRRR